MKNLIIAFAFLMSLQFSIAKAPAIVDNSTAIVLQEKELENISTLIPNAENARGTIKASKEKKNLFKFNFKKNKTKKFLSGNKAHWTNIVSLITGILGLILIFVLPLLGLLLALMGFIFGIIGITGGKGGKGMGIAGLICGALAILLAILLIAIIAAIII